MATVYLARFEEGKGRSVDDDAWPLALKVLHPHLAADSNLRKMFLHEGSLSRRLRHPNVVYTHAFGEHPELGVYLLMDFVDGADLATVLRHRAQGDELLDARIGARLLYDTLLGLSAAHRLTDDHGEPLNLVHRDISPHNILVGSDGGARLIDFGIAKSDERYTMTRPGQLRGKLAYMAPEQFSSEGYGQRADVFAMGVILWEVLVLRRLFRGGSDAATIQRVLECKAPPPSQLSARLAPFDVVVAKALARDPDDRFQDAGAMAEAVAEAADVIGGMATTEEVAPIAQSAALAKEEQEMDDDADEQASVSRIRLMVTPATAHSLSGYVERPRAKSYLWIAAGVLAGASLASLGLFAFDGPAAPDESGIDSAPFAAEATVPAELPSSSGSTETVTPTATPEPRSAVIAAEQTETETEAERTPTVDEGAPPRARPRRVSRRARPASPGRSDRAPTSASGSPSTPTRPPSSGTPRLLPNPYGTTAP